MSFLKKALDAQQFVCVLEWTPRDNKASAASLHQLMKHQHLAGMPLVAALADRVGQSAQLSSLASFERHRGPFPTLLHFSGKDRAPQQLQAQLEQMQEFGLHDLLLLSGDRDPTHTPGQRSVRYLESVPALQQARHQLPGASLGAALNPFKYLEEEGIAQYYKAHKKLIAGADFLTVQLGFDVAKYDEAWQWMHKQVSPKPLMACVMALTHTRAQFLRHVPGVVITRSMMDLLAAEEQQGADWSRQRSTERLALQILGLQLKGYAGVHLSGIHGQTQFSELENALERLRGNIETQEQWSEAWASLWQYPGTGKVNFAPEESDWAPGLERVQASIGELRRFRRLQALHHLFFSEQSVLGRALGSVMCWPLWQSPIAARILHRVERGIKRPVLGCDTCGHCRLEQTLYVCPETCPKGLANGPCGGTHLNRCEFGDRECIHSVKYRISVSAQQSQVLREVLIPIVPEQTRHQSSWPRWFRPDDAI